MNILNLVLKGALAVRASFIPLEDTISPKASPVLGVVHDSDDETASADAIVEAGNGWLADSQWYAQVKVVVEESARTFSNVDHYVLNFEDLCSEIWMRLVKCKKLNTFFPHRKNEFFSYAKTVSNNRARTLCARHFQTGKRAGDFGANGKPTHITLDDPEYSDRMDFRSTEQAPSSALPEGWLDDIATLSPIEKLVLGQVTEPSEASLTIARLCNKRRSSREVVVRNEHHAAALGMELTEFLRVLQNTRQKIMAYKSAEEDIEYNRAMAQLEEAFHIHVPTHLDSLLVRRLITLAARDNYEILNDTLRAALRTVGAKVPEVQGGVLRCYGVLYAAKDRACNACGLRVACATEAANFGLGQITLSPTLIGAHSPRIPSVVPRTSADLPAFGSARDEMLWAWLTENLELLSIRGSFWVRVDGADAAGETVGSTTGLMFNVTTQGHIRFCEPVETAGMVGRDGQWFLRDSATLDEALALFNRHMASVTV